MKSFGTVASIINGTNKLVSSTRCNWSKLKRGALVQINGTNDHLVIDNFERIIYCQPFTVKNKNCITIPSNTKPYIQVGDSIIMVFEQYEMSDEFFIASQGSGYNVGDLLFYDTGAEQSILISVEGAVNGGIVNFKILNRGTFNVPFAGDLKFNSEKGEGFVLIAKPQKRAQKNKTDRECLSVVYSENETSIYFLHGLPSHVVSGEITLNKWVCSLSQNFYNVKGDVLAGTYKFFTELTPNYNFPLLLPHHQNPEELFNKFFYSLDSTLHLLQDQITQLKSKLPTNE